MLTALIVLVPSMKTACFGMASRAEREQALVQHQSSCTQRSHTLTCSGLMLQQV